MGKPDDRFAPEMQQPLAAALAGPCLRRPARSARRSPPAVLIAAAAVLAGLPVTSPAGERPALASAAVAVRDGSGSAAYEGVVEAQRQTVVAAQVAGAVVELSVRAGDKVQAGQVLLRIDSRAADQTAAAGAAQARAAQAAMQESQRDFDRQRQLFAQGYISQAALDRTQAQFSTAQAAASAQLANAAAARTQSELSIVRAPYAGVVAGVTVVLGEMALPGRPLLTMYDPTALRVTAAIPQTAAVGPAGRAAPRIEIPGALAVPIEAVRVQRLPTVDAASHTLEWRLDLPAGTDAVPGMFARVWLPASSVGATDARLFVPAQALVRRTELAAVYVIGRDGRPMLRPVRPGRGERGEVEILSGVAAGERVALDPQAAARRR